MLAICCSAKTDIRGQRCLKKLRYRTYFGAILHPFVLEPELQDIVRERSPPCTLPSTPVPVS